MAKDLAVFGFSVPLSENHISEMTRERLDMIITAEAARYYQMAKKMLVQNRKLLEAVAEALYNEKVLLYKRIAEIKAQVAQAG